MNIKMIIGALKSPKTPKHLKEGLMRKFGSQLQAAGYKSMGGLTATVKANPKKRQRKKFDKILYENYKYKVKQSTYGYEVINKRTGSIVASGMKTIKEAKHVFDILSKIKPNPKKRLTSLDKQSKRVDTSLAKQLNTALEKRKTEGHRDFRKNPKKSNAITILYNIDYEEYRVPGKNGKEASAYYTSDKRDALGTAKEIYGYEIFKIKRVHSK